MQKFFKDLTFQIQLTLSSVPQVFKRNRHVLILLKDWEGKYILGAKKHCPPGIFRLLGGGLDSGEDPVLGAVRELFEETGIKAEPDLLVPLALINSMLLGPQRENWKFSSFVFGLKIHHTPVQPNDDVDEVVRLSEKEFERLISHFYQLPSNIHPEMNFSWMDYGQVYGRIHEIALQQAKIFLK